MQDDLSDAVDWAVAQRIADPKRVAIAGASYGGYAALMGAVLSPERYRCAFSFAGITDLIDQIRHDSQYRGGADLVVPVAQSRQMADAMRAAGGQVRYIEQRGVGHHPGGAGPLREFLSAQAEFLPEHLGPAKG